MNWKYNKHIERFKDWWVWKFQNDYNINMPYGYCPVQIEGYLSNGEYYYFRARHNSWSFKIAKSETHLDNNKHIFYHIDNTSYVGFMLKRDAIKLANKAVRLYVKRKLSGSTKTDHE